MTTPPGTVSEKLGPGAFVAVVGPSGAGKDTLLDLARVRLADREECWFPRRAITRGADASGEDHEAVSGDTFKYRLAEGAYALTWDAHGLSYGIPISVDTAIAGGSIVLCNLSRSAIPEVLDRYRRVVVVHVTAPVNVLAERLAQRGREDPADIQARLARATFDLPEAREVVVIDNVGAPEEAAERIVDLALSLVPSEERRT
ncbi:MAG: phosphonate metabolism protein/1,5-bisphosphokinase (PRPP-forming) PhnN [Pseudomonadota bacterium]